MFYQTSSVGRPQNDTCIVEEKTSIQERPIAYILTPNAMRNGSVCTQVGPAASAPQATKSIYLMYLQANLPLLFNTVSLYDVTRKRIGERLNIELCNAAQQVKPHYGQLPRAVQLFLVHVSAQSIDCYKSKRRRLAVVDAFYTFAYHFKDCVKSVVMWNCNLPMVSDILGVDIGLDDSMVMEDKFYLVVRYVESSVDGTRIIRKKWMQLPPLFFASNNTMEHVIVEDSLKSLVAYIHDVVLHFAPVPALGKDPHLFHTFQLLVTRAVPQTSQDGFVKTIQAASASFFRDLQPPPFTQKKSVPDFKDTVPFVDVGVVLRCIPCEYLAHIMHKREYSDLQHMYRSSDDYDENELLHYLRSHVLPATRLLRVAARCDESQPGLTKKKLLDVLVNMKFHSDLEEHVYINEWDLHFVGHVVTQMDMSQHVSQYAFTALTSTCAVTQSTALSNSSDFQPILYVNQVQCQPYTIFPSQEFFIFLDCNPNNVRDYTNTYSASLPIYNKMRTKELEVIDGLNALKPHDWKGWPFEPINPNQPCLDSMLFDIEEMGDFNLQNVLDAFNFERNPIAAQFYIALTNFYGPSTKARDAIAQATLLFQEMRVHNISMSDVHLAVLLNDKRERDNSNSNKRKGL